ncbi:MAG: hypothetical protein LBH43_16635 [Treponema sp.]|jgi:hypothetical protein|nr:hypothetical protein [Treponema sp.]
MAEICPHYNDAMDLCFKKGSSNALKPSNNYRCKSDDWIRCERISEVNAAAAYVDPEEEKRYTVIRCVIGLVLLVIGITAIAAAESVSIGPILVIIALRLILFNFIDFGGIIDVAITVAIIGFIIRGCVS